tara:strand:+ start:280 stop:1668 length:1389 start_codon:yes stop_codon:yes gene_type:complete
MQFKSFISKNITEAVALTPAQLDANNSKTGRARIDILRQLVVQQKPLELAKGGSIVVSNIDDALVHIANFKKNPLHYGKKGFPLETDNGTYMSNQLAKSEVFGGGGGGAGSGEKQTRRNEVHNAVMMHAMLEHGYNQPLEFFNRDIMKSAYKDAEVDASFDEIEDMPDDWNLSSYNISKELIRRGYVKKGHTIHRGSSEMIRIYALKNRAYKNMDVKPLKDDKWNPGDVWAIADGFDVDSLDTTSVDGLNADILENFLNRMLVGISLKGPMTNNVPIKELNIDKSLLKTYKYISFDLESKGGTYWSAKNGSLIFNSGTLMFKDNKQFGNIKAEIKGTKARGGGLSWGIMDDFLVRHGRKYGLPKHSAYIVKQAKKMEKGDERAIKEYYEYFNHFYNNVSYNEFKRNLKQKDGQWISSKFAITMVAYQLEQLGGTQLDEVITNFINYAGSELDESSAFVKAGK